MIKFIHPQLISYFVNVIVLFVAGELYSSRQNLEVLGYVLGCFWVPFEDFGQRQILVGVSNFGAVKFNMVYGISLVVDSPQMDG